MCHDLSFSANTVEFITDLLPNIIWDKQLSIDFLNSDHLFSFDHPKALAIFYKDGVPHGDEFSWKVIFNFMNTAEKIKEYRHKYGNTKAESIFERPWNTIKKQRCLIATRGIFEHREVMGLKRKIPYHIKLACADNMLLPAFYNYSPIGDPETGEVMGTFSLVTVPANELMKKIHNSGEFKHRMPLFMQQDMALRWIQEDLNDEQLKAFVNYQIPSVELEACAVDPIRRVKVRMDGRKKYEPTSRKDIPPFGIDEVVTQNDLFSEQSFVLLPDARRIPKRAF